MKSNVLAVNKRASFNYSLLKDFDAGIVLNGWEIKSIREKNVTIKDAFAIVKRHEIFLINMHIAPYKFSTESFSNLDPIRSRKLLLNKSEIRAIEKDIKLEKVILVPTKLYLKNNFVKIKIYTAKAKKNYDKREVTKEREISREIAKKYKNNN